MSLKGSGTTEAKVRRAPGFHMYLRYTTVEPLLSTSGTKGRSKAPAPLLFSTSDSQLLLPSSHSSNVSCHLRL